MSTRVYVGRISPRARDRDVERLFRSYGKIREIVFKNGYGFVEFDDYRDAEDAVYELNGRDLCGERIIVEHARGTARGKDKYTGGRPWGGGGDDYRRSSGSSRAPSWLDKYGPPTRTEYRLIVENLSSRVSWQDLKDYMRQAGEVTYADAHKDRKNEGVVEFATYSDLQTALDKLDGTEINGRRIKLVEEHPRKRSVSRSRSRSRSESAHSRSRSRSPRRSTSKSPRQNRKRTPKRSRSASPRKSRSASPKKSSRVSAEKGSSRSPEKMGSISPRKSKDVSPEKRVSPSPRSKSKSPAQSKSKSPAQSRSRSPKYSHASSRSASPKSRSVSRSPAANGGRRSRSPTKSRGSSASGGSMSRSRSRSRSISPAIENGGD